jgi:hypothetical protein
VNFPAATIEAPPALRPPARGSHFLLAAPAADVYTLRFDLAKTAEAELRR